MTAPMPVDEAGSGRSLDADLMAAHETGDGQKLVELYAKAAEAAQAAGDPSQAAFFRTHAFVFALETGHPMAERLHRALCAGGHDE